MLLKSIILENFRSYKERTRIDFEDNLTALIGRNDAGKSSILEALEIFFNAEQIKFEKADLCVHQDGSRARIGCVFAEFPEELIIDARAKTTLREEFLLNKDGDLEIHKIFDCSLKTPKEIVVAITEHPVGDDVENLLLKKNDELKSILSSKKIPTDKIDQRSNVQLRRAIRSHAGSSDLKTTEIPLDSEDAKKAWDQLKQHLPIYALFRADRPSQDADDEVQNPLKVAVVQALKDLQSDLDKIQNKVRDKANEVALLTLEKLKELDPRLAAQLKPDFKAEPKWDKLFSFSLTGDDGIPINKRGSGVRRLILISFFRAQAEQRRIRESASHIIYAIEEPETSQNPLNQRLLVESLLDLAAQDGIQVLLTTHTPGLAGLLPNTSLRHIEQNEEKLAVVSFGEGIFLRIAQELGITADRRLQLLLCVEGPGDVEYLKKFSHLLNAHDNTLVNLTTDPRATIVPVGGSTLRQWIENHYLRGLNIPEVHIYDRGGDTPPKYQNACDQVNTRTDGSWAVLTARYEIENYLHPDIITELLGVAHAMPPNEDVVVQLIQLCRQNNPDAEPWDNMDSDKKKKLEGTLKKRLAVEALPRMTIEKLQEVDQSNEIESWLRRISEMLR